MILRPPAWASVHAPCSIAFGVCLAVVLTILPVPLTEAAEGKPGACDEASQGIAQGIAKGTDNACAESSDTGFGEQREDDLDIFVIVPHLEDRELGEPNLDDEGEVVIWDHPLPFFG